MNQPRVRAKRLRSRDVSFAAITILLAIAFGGCNDGRREAADETAPAGISQAPGTRNLVLVSLDTLRADHLGLYGYARATTPNLDRFAEGAAVFEGARSNASSTRPSHQALFQSRPASLAQQGGQALAEVLAEQGFRTAAFTGGGNISSRLGFDRGFERYEESDGGLAGSIPRAATWLREHRDERFFLFLHTYDIHLPYDPPEPYASKFAADYEGQVRGSNTRLLLRASRGLDSGGASSVGFTAADKDRVVSLYDGGILYTDNQLNHLFTLFRELDLARDTLVVFFSDHGEEFWEHGSVIHSHALYRELLHVPLIIAGPDLPAARVAETVSLMDLSPTLLEWLAVPAPPSFEGTSFAGWLRGDAREHRAFIAEQRKLKSWIQHPWKLILNEAPTPPELYDVATDPLEQSNVAAANPDVVARLTARLEARIAGHLDAEVLEIEPGIDDPEHLERLRALGYIE
ncbi:MAG: sulfatase [Myxococcota bacterium]|jgi:arylsulfatase A-like enzyme|nr:sulfatase [Myxococcota bacterium]